MLKADDRGETVAVLGWQADQKLAVGSVLHMSWAMTYEGEVITAGGAGGAGEVTAVQKLTAWVSWSSAKSATAATRIRYKFRPARYE